MAEKHIIVPALHAEIKFIGFDAHNTPVPSDSTKVKLVDVHPVKSLMASVDGDGRLVVWDYNLKTELCNTLTPDIFNSPPVYSVLPSRSDDSFIKQRLSRRSQMATMCRVDHILNNDYCAAITAPNEPLSTKPRTNASHTIRQITFCDASAIHATCYSTGKHSIHQPSMHSTNCLLVVSDNAVVLFDYITKKGQIITEAELTKPPTSAEMLFHNCCAIACSDGSIRLWDLKANEPNRTLSGHARGAVVVKAIPIKSENSNGGTTESSDKVRLLSVGADGTAFLWDLHMCIGPKGSLLIDDGSSPSARLKDLPACAGLNRNHIHYDCETNLVSVNVNDSKIKQWDMSDMINVSRSSLRSSGHHASNSSGSSSSLRAKRMSVMNMVGGGGGAGRDQFDHVHSIGCLSSMKPGEKKDKKVDVSGFAPLTNPQFTSDSFVICSKTNFLGIYKSREASMADDRSERSSVMGGGTEKSQRLQLLNELNVSALLQRFFETRYPTVFMPEPLKELLRQGGVKVYTLRVPTTQPHLWVLGTSVGTLLLSLSTNQSGSLCGVHPLWSNIKLMFSGNSIKKILLDSPAMNPDGKSIRRVPSGRQSFTDDTSSVHGGGGVSGGTLHPELDVGIEIVGELSITDAGAGGTVNVPQPKRLSFAPSVKKAAAAAGEVPSGRPLFYPSPSGEYCAIHFADTLQYLVVKVDPTIRGRKDLVEVDRGFALEFGWLGTQDYYLIKTASFIATVGSKRRSSIMNLMSAAEKEVSRLHAPQLALFRCAGEGKAERVPFVYDALHTSFFGTAMQVTTAVHLHGGPLIAITTERKHGEVISVKNPAAGASTAGAAGGPTTPADPNAAAPAPTAPIASAGVLISDVEKAERDIKYAVPVAKSQLITRFYCLVPLSEAKRLEAAAAAEAARAGGVKPKKPPKVASTPAATDDAAAAGAPVVGSAYEDGAMSLVQVGPTLNCVDAVRWEPTTGLLAVLHSDSDDVSVLRLTAGGDGHLSMHSVGNVSGGPSLPLSRGLTDLTWSGESVLYCASSNDIIAIACNQPSTASGASNEPHITELHMKYSAPLMNARPTAVLRPSFSASDFSPLPWSQAIGSHHGCVYVYYRDGTVRKIAVTSQPALAVALLTNQLKYTSEEKQPEVNDLLNKWLSAVDVTEQQAVQCIVNFQ